MANISLVIDVESSAHPTGSKLNEWTELDNVEKFIEKIITPKISENTNIGTLVSGIPTAFARVDLFNLALRSEAAGNKNRHGDTNLNSFYSQLVDEWKGLIACMALDYAHISVKRIELAYSDGEDLGKTANVYEPKGAFGNMLLRRKKRWCVQNTPGNKDVHPYINIIKYYDKVVGATAPESLLFTSSGYKCQQADDKPWISKDNRFTDPLKSNMTAEQLAALHAYVSQIEKGLGEAEEYYANLPQGEQIHYVSIRTILTNWKEEIESKAKSDNIDLSIGSIPPVNASFGEPFAKLFCHKDVLNGLEGVISESQQTGGVEFDPKNLLLDDTARIAKLDLNIKPEELAILPILVMSADIKGMQEKAYFALPLSAEGLNVFGRNVGALVGMSGSNTAIQSELKAQYDPMQRNGNLEVELTLVTNTGVRRQFKKVYTCDGSISNKDILVWPNFISPQWDAYFMYNEMPHNGTSQSYRAFPFVGEMQNNYFRIIVDSQSNPVLLTNDGKITAPENIVKSELLVKCDEAVADNPYKYEIYRSNKPFKGVRLLSPTGAEGGYLLINYGTAQDTTLPHDWMRPGAHSVLQEVNLGIDFGSTNTSIAYSSNSTQEQGFDFDNQRVSLMGNELPDHPLFPRENQVFFFKGAGPKVASNAIKSVLTLHDNRRLPDLQPGETIKMRDEREVVGGFPCFADNLPFSNSDKTKITLFYPNGGIGEVTQIHNMKWEDNDTDKAHKSAFLRTLMLQVYACLFAQGMVPKRLKWSYPSAMAGQLLYSYDNIWQGLSSISPVLDVNGQRYMLDVSRYAGNQLFGHTIGTGAFGNEQDSSQIDGFGGDFSNGFGNENGFGGNDFSGEFGEFDNSLENSENAFGNGFNSGFECDFDSKVQQPLSKLENEKDFMPDNPEEKISYDPKPLYTLNNSGSNPSLSEAEAVANFISVKYGKETNVLNLCFDVGGSTTDISALFFLKGNITMIKQNSLRFAAQRVSQAVAHFPQFRSVLTGICAKYKIHMVGLNVNNKKYYNENTAPYFFDQIVSKLNDNQLEDLYRTIAAECPLLMCVNMYVTGLLMYYAGQIAHKLIDDLNKTSDTEWQARRKPRVRITFAGKGSRLYQWLSTINPEAARTYYGKSFILGYGENHLKKTLSGWQDIQLPKLHDPEIKFEVSKGLAKGNTSLQKPSKNQPSEIIGESGFEVTGMDYVPRPLEFTNSINPAMLESIGVRLCADTQHKQADKFTEFCGWFYTAARKLFKWSVNPRELESACRNMNIIAYVQNMPEFRSAQDEATQGGEPFSFVAPIIILEGMKFYDETLMNLLK